MNNAKAINRRDVLRFTTKLTVATIAASQGLYLIGSATSKADDTLGLETLGLKACVPCFCCSAFQCLSCPPTSTPFCGPTDPCNL